MLDIHAHTHIHTEGALGISLWSLLMTSKKFYKEKQLSANEVKESLKKCYQDASLSVLSRPKSIAQGWGRGGGGAAKRDAHSEEKSRWAPEGRPSSLKNVANEDGLNSDCLEGDSRAHRVLQLLAS